MRFGGHETFPIREGWLHKGLKLLIEQPERLIEEFVADYLGVGRNMAKSIKHWLVATGLAQQSYDQKNIRLQKTDLGQLIYGMDPYFSDINTWWALHINLINNPNHAASWHWFFNNFNQIRFERAVCIEGLRRHLQLSNMTMPSIKTLQRDLSCLLSSYSKKIPMEREDPEEALDCPFIELGLITHFRSSGYYQINQGPKEIPLQLFGYALSKALSKLYGEAEKIEITVREATQQSGGPGRAFVLNNESLFEVLLKLEGLGTEDDIQIIGLAGERVIHIKQRDPLEWLRHYYQDIEYRSRYAA